MKIKTFGLIAFLAIASLTLTGCGSEKVVCTLSEEWTSMDIIMKFNGDDMSYMWLKASIEVPPEVTDDMKDSFSKMMKESLEESEGFSGLKNYESKWDGNTLIITADWNIEYDDTQLKKDEAIKLREEEWFEC